MARPIRGSKELATPVGTRSRASDSRYAAANVGSFFFSSRRRHTRLQGDWSSDVCSSDLKLGDAGVRMLDSLLQRTNLTIEAVSVEQAYIARQAWSSYGKGRHPASLNFGDTFTYALAKTTGEAVLCKGKDFAQTDIQVVL